MYVKEAIVYADVYKRQGFKNAHTHTPMTFLRSFADDLPLQEWLQQKEFPNEARLKGEDTYWLAILGIMEYLTSGITSNFDMYIKMCIRDRRVFIAFQIRVVCVIVI